MAKAYDPRDPYYRKAKQQQLRARSAFKIEEIVERFQLVGKGDVVVDLGAAPGGFLQVLATAVGQGGRIVGVDIVPIRPLGGVVATITSDVYAPTLEQAIRDLLPGQADLVATDLAPKTTGIRDADEARSVALVDRALELARGLLKPGGHFVAKVFMGGDFDALFGRIRAEFAEAKVVRPEATRARSREVYVVGKRFRATGAGKRSENKPSDV